MSIGIQYDYRGIGSLDTVISEAALRVGLNPRQLDEDHTFSIMNSIQLELLSQPVQGSRLWLRKKFMFQLVANQITYTFPDYIVSINDVVACVPVRMNTGGIAASSAGGEAANCFNPTQTAGCIQTSPDGNISYNYGANNSQLITYVGISSLTVSDYTIAIDYTLDGVNWETAATNPTTRYIPGAVIWTPLEYNFVAQGWRIRETKGATLAIQQIYFSQPNPGTSSATASGYADAPLTAISQQIYMFSPNKSQAGSPYTYYFDNIYPPTLTVWLGPNLNPYTNLLGVVSRLPRSPDEWSEQLDMPPYAYDSFICGVAVRLAEKIAPDRVPLLLDSQKRALILLTATNYQKVPLVIKMGGR